MGQILNFDGRSRQNDDGSYAEFTRAGVQRDAVRSVMVELAAIPETYAAAWKCLLRNLELTAGQSTGYTAVGTQIRAHELVGNAQGQLERNRGGEIEAPMRPIYYL